MDQLIADRDSFMAVVRKWHAGHARPDQVEHCENVAKLLDDALDLDTPSVAARRDMILAALGHDLYEDSKIPQAEIGKFGKEVGQLIRALTEDKDGVGPYVERVASGGGKGGRKRCQFIFPKKMGSLKKELTRLFRCRLRASSPVTFTATVSPFLKRLSLSASIRPGCECSLLSFEQSISAFPLLIRLFRGLFPDGRLFRGGLF